MKDEIEVGCICGTTRQDETRRETRDKRNERQGSGDVKNRIQDAERNSKSKKQNEIDNGQEPDKRTNRDT